MKRMTFLLLAALTALFAVLVALDVINFETDRIDRWVMIFGFAGVAFFVGLASADGSGSSSGEPTSERAAAQRALGERRPDPSALPARPGSLLRTAGSSDTTNPSEPEELSLDLVALESDPLEAELQEMIDEDQMDEITALVGETDAETGVGDTEVVALQETPPAHETAGPTPWRAGEPDSATRNLVPEPVPTDGGIDPAITPVTSDIESAPDEPLARIELRLADYDDEALQKLVKDSEALVIAEMVRTGQLTSAGELTERDIASMVFLAYTSDEMLAELRLRKSLDQPGEVAVTDRALAPLKNIE